MIKKILTALFILLFSIMMSIVNPNGINKDNLWAAKKSAKSKETKEKDNSFSLNFNDVEISEFINVMSQVLGKNIILSDKVRGKITINSARKVPVSEAYELMKSILEIKGFSVIETDNLIKIVPIKEAVQKNVEIILDGDKVKLDRDNAITFLVELKYSDANEVANVLRALKTPETDIVVYKTLNTLIFSGNSNDIKGLVKITQTLDRKPAGTEEDIEKVKEGATIHVVNLENADATTLAEVLSRIPFSQNAVINTNPIKSYSGEIKDKSSPNKQHQQGQIQQTQRQNTPQKLSIIANKDTNSLIINALPEEYKEILRIIKQLDVVRPQVLIEAMIVEVDVESNWGLGIDWTLGGQQGQHMFGGSSIMGSNIPSYSLPSGITDKTVAVPLTTHTMTLGYLSDTSILGFVLLNATGQDKDINVLSTPHILTIDNHEAEFNVGKEIGVPTNSRMDSNSNVYYTYEYKPVGLKLKLTPHITHGEKITLDLFVEVNSVLDSTTSADNKPPDLTKRDIKTKISIKDGSTIVVGGLMRNSVTEIEYKVPLLGDIPLLGWLFKNKTKETSKTNLLVFITPRVVTDTEKIKKITEEKQQELKKIQEENKK